MADSLRDFLAGHAAHHVEMAKMFSGLHKSHTAHAEATDGETAKYHALRPDCWRRNSIQGNGRGGIFARQTLPDGFSRGPGPEMWEVTQ